MKKQSYEKFLEDYEKDFKKNAQNIQNRGVDLIQDKHIKFWSVYKTIETNKRLVWATWSLAIVTIILSIINLFLRFG